MSVGVKGLGVNVVYAKGLVASWATQPLNVSEDMVFTVVSQMSGTRSKDGVNGRL